MNEPEVGTGGHARCLRAVAINCGEVAVSGGLTVASLVTKHFQLYPLLDIGMLKIRSLTVILFYMTPASHELHWLKQCFFVKIFFACLPKKPV